MFGKGSEYASALQTYFVLKFKKKKIKIIECASKIQQPLY